MSVDVKMFDSESKDQLTRERGLCLEKDCATRPFFLALRECARRVAKKAAYTAETCHQETVELMEAIDRCVKDKAFVKLL
ncbi:uncharacterized protein LOC124642015 [Helicoverpa zea]|uniref:uncharacterized protein LOC124642015 n=1 Tax=Helicoverpa zea TaxID=7113 RepID=UPI000B383E68|nr:uncharacterized protein LOC124642015 [Helicoverpa zea]